MVRPGFAGRHEHKEAEYRDAWCRGTTEVKIYDGSRIDCMTANYAIEFDFAPKWAEALGQSLHYAQVTGKDPAMVLIIEKESDWKYYQRVKRTALKKGVKLWYMTPEQLAKKEKK